MPVIKKTAIRNANTQVYEERDLGAEAQNIDVSFDSNGTIIENVTDPTAVADVEPLSTVLKDIESDVSTNTTNISNITSGNTKIGGVKLGTSGSGSSKTYGYYKDGSSTLTPFRNPTGDATSAHVLSGKYFSNASSDGLQGSIPNLSTSNITIESGGGSYNSLVAGKKATIPSGYYVASNTVITARSLADQTSADATAGQILKNKTAWVNGSKVTGTMTPQGGQTNRQSTSSNSTNVYTRIPQGAYLTNAGGQSYPEIVTPLSDFGTVSRANVLNGQTFTSTAGLATTGTMTNQGAYTASVGNLVDGNGQLYVRIPQGAYITNGADGYPEITVPADNASYGRGYNSGYSDGKTAGHAETRVVSFYASPLEFSSTTCKIQIGFSGMAGSSPANVDLSSGGTKIFNVRIGYDFATF